MNYKYADIVVIHPHHRPDAWERAVQAAGFAGRNELHGGLLGVCTALWLCPDTVKWKDAGAKVPTENNAFSDYLGWDLLTVDGNWGEFRMEEGMSKEELAKRGELLWTTLIQLNCEGLRQHLEETYRRKLEHRGNDGQD